MLEDIRAFCLDIGDEQQSVIDELRRTIQDMSISMTGRFDALAAQQALASASQPRVTSPPQELPPTPPRLARSYFAGASPTSCIAQKAAGIVPGSATRPAAGTGISTSTSTGTGAGAGIGEVTPQWLQDAANQCTTGTDLGAGTGGATPQWLQDATRQCTGLNQLGRPQMQQHETRERQVRWPNQSQSLPPPSEQQPSEHALHLTPLRRWRTLPPSSMPTLSGAGASAESTRTSGHLAGERPDVSCPPSPSAADDRARAEYGRVHRMLHASPSIIARFAQARRRSVQERKARKSDRVDAVLTTSATPAQQSNEYL